MANDARFRDTLKSLLAALGSPQPRRRQKARQTIRDTLAMDTAAVKAEIERVRSLSGAALQRRWQSDFGRPPPRSLTIARRPAVSSPSPSPIPAVMQHMAIEPHFLKLPGGGSLRIGIVNRVRPTHPIHPRVVSVFSHSTNGRQRRHR